MAITIKSAPVPSGVAAQHQEYNNLRRDVLTHVHDGNTSRVNHGNLLSAGTNTDAQIDTHIAASAGVHGGQAGDSVVLSKITGLTMQKGTFTKTISGDKSNSSWNEGDYKDVTFDEAFSEGCMPIVMIQAYNTTAALEDAWVVTEVLTNINRNGFRVYFYNHDTGEIGTMYYQYVAWGW